MAELRLSLLASDANIVGYWRYEANSNGTVGPNGTDTSMTYTAGKFGNAATFNGSSSKIVYSFTQPTSAYSIVAWIKGNNSVSDTNYRIYDSQDSGTPSTGVVFVMNPSLGGSTKNLRVYHNNGSWSTSDNLATNINDNTYHHIGVTWDGSTHKFYVDGALVGSPSYSTAVTNSGFLDIGHGRATSTFWNGQIDDVGVFSRVLTLSEIQTLYNDPTAKSANDTGSGSDAKSITVTQTRADTGTGTDTKAISVTVPTHADTGSGIDANAITVSQTRADTGTGVDAKSISVTPPTQADTGSGSDAESILNTITRPDTGTGTDEKSIAASIAAADTGTASESLAILAKIAIAETGSGVDVKSTQAHVSAPDTVSANDAVAILAHIARSDSGIATDALAAMARIAVSESGTANDALAFLIAKSINEFGGDDDTVSILAHVGVSDSVHAADALAVAFYIAVQDSTPHGVDALSFLISPAVSDSVSASDAVHSVEIFRKMINDAGQGSDAVTGILNRFTVPDTGVGAELLNLVKRIYPYIKRPSPYAKLKP